VTEGDLDRKKLLPNPLAIVRICVKVRIMEKVPAYKAGSCGPPAPVAPAPVAQGYCCEVKILSLSFLEKTALWSESLAQLFSPRHREARARWVGELRLYSRDFNRQEPS